jgi:hypothetical protein
MLGMQVFWAPTDVADHYVGTPQREIACALKPHPLPELLPNSLPNIEVFQDGACMCGPGLRCRCNYGWDAICPVLELLDQDLVVESTEQLYSWCKELGITHLIYLGFHTNCCTTGKPVGIGPMLRTGLKAILARDMTDGISGYDPTLGENPDKGTKEIIQQLETAMPTIHLANEFIKEGLWQEDWLVDPVRVTPWGQLNRPYFFENDVTVTLSAPLNEGAEIRYTIDGSEPDENSTLYSTPFSVIDTTNVRAKAYRDGVQVCLEGNGYMVRLPAMPPMPDVHLSDIEPLRQTVPGYHLYISHKQPAKDMSYTNTPLTIRDTKYEKGMGVQAPSQLLYTIKPEYDRFVGLAGNDEAMFSDDWGREKAMYPSVIFKVFIDGTLVTESPILRIAQGPWRFNIPIPEGCGTISLVVTSVDDDNRYDFANWVNAGFVLKR